MRNCLLSPGEKQYNAKTEFVSYAIQNMDGSRFLILQYQRGESDEHFVVIKPKLITDNIRFMAVGRVEREDKEQLRQYKSVVNIASKSDVIQLLQQKSTRYHMNIVPRKDLLEEVLNTFSGVEVVRASGVAQALNIICEPARQLLRIEINPVELALSLAELSASKVAEGRKVGCIVS